MGHIGELTTEYTAAIGLSRGSNEYTLISRLYSHSGYFAERTNIEISISRFEKNEGYQLRWIFLKNEV